MNLLKQLSFSVHIVMQPTPLLAIWVVLATIFFNSLVVALTIGTMVSSVIDLICAFHFNIPLYAGGALLLRFLIGSLS